MRSFYVGSYFVSEYPDPVQQDWLFPDNLEHSRETSNVEDLNINPEDIDLFPLEVQAGCESYTRITFSSIPDFYVAVSPGIGGFYVPNDIEYSGGFYLLLVDN